METEAVAEKEAEKIPEPSSPKSKSLTVGEKGQLALASLEDQLAFAQRLIQDKMISSTFQTPQQVVIAFQYAKAMNMPEILAVKLMYVVNNRPCLYSEGPLSLCQRNPAWAKMREYFVTEAGDEICPKNKNLKEKSWAAVCEVWRKGDEVPQVDWFSMDDLKVAQLDVNSKNEKKEVWAKWERIMMRYKARAICLRSKFADSLAGIPIAEYDENVAPEVPLHRDVTKSSSDDINSKYLKGGDDAAKEGEAQR